MISSIGQVQTPLASTYLQRLCKHFSKKIEVEYGETKGYAAFPYGRCRLQADAETLIFHCETEEAEAMLVMQDVISRHVGMFTKRNPLTVTWRDNGADRDSGGRQ